MHKRILVMLLAVALVLSLVTGCSNGSKPDSSTADPGQEEASGEPAEEPYEINFQYLVAFEGPDQEEVAEAINELTMKELNMTVNLLPMTFGTYQSQISAILASSEPLDVVLVESSNFATYIESQYIVNMKDYLDYAPDILSIRGDGAGTYIDDFLVGFGSMGEMSQATGLIVRKDIFDELGYKVSDFNVTTDDYDSFNQITELFAKVKEKYPEMDCLDGTRVMGLQNGSYADRLGSDFGVLENYGQTTTITNWFESDQYRKFCEIARDWYTKGYSSPDIAINMDSGETKIKAGNCFSFIGTIKPNTAIEKRSITGYDVEVIPMSTPAKASERAIVYAIANSSKNPQKAMEFLNWANTSQEFEDLINWGIEGKHWVEDSDGLAAYPEGVDLTSVGYHNDFGWAYPNQFAGHAWAGNPPDIWEQYQEYNDSLMKSKAYGFTFNSASLATETTQLNAVLSQYKNDLAFGVVEIDSTLEAFNKALYDAGLQKVIDEKQAQLDAWLAQQ